MTEHDAQTHLRAIRQLMERATIYRAISAPTALFGGLLSLGVAAGQLLAILRPPAAGDGDGRPGTDVLVFFLTWSVVFLLSAAANALFIWHGARQRGEPLVSPAMKLALRAVAPALLAGATLGFTLALTSGLTLLPVLFWIVFYGLGLLATLPFAPSSLIALGWAFLLTGLIGFTYLVYHTLLPDYGLPTPNTALAPALMAGTFGGYHLLYAACVWPRRGRALDAIERRPLVSASTADATGRGAASSPEPPLV